MEEVVPSIPSDLIPKALEEVFDFLGENKNPPKIKQYFGKEELRSEDVYSSENTTEKVDINDEPNVLAPDHPLLAKFQLALKEHLQKQIAHVNVDIFEYEIAAKKKNVEREGIGCQAYELQQSVVKQQGVIDSFVAELENVTAAREELENQLQDTMVKYREEKNELYEAEKKEVELRKEIESVDLLLQQMSKWETDIENELKTKHTMFEKTKREKLKLAQEKREQDMMLYKMMSEVWRLEGELETMLMQLRVKEEEREKLAENLAIHNTEIEATQAEHRCLIRGWNSVVVAISARDKHFNIINKELVAYQEKLRSVISEIEQVKKLCKREMNKNETLTMFKSRVESDINSCKHQTEVEDSKRTNLERTIMHLQASIEQTTKDLNRVTTENHIQARDLKVFEIELERLGQRKMYLEETIMNILQEQITNDKASKYLAKALRDARSKNRELEITLSNTENRNARGIMDMESQKRVNAEYERQLAELLKQQMGIEKRLTEYTEELQHLHSLSNKREREVHILNRKLDKLMESLGGTERSPHELKISALEQHIAAIEDKTKELQKFWLREQGHVVCLSEQRQEQIHDSNLLRKQTMILEQRNLKITDELNIFKKQEDTMMRNINKLQNQLLAYTERLGKKRCSKQFLDETTNVVQTDFSFKLKDLEFEVIKLSSELQDMEEDMNNLSRDLMEKNREALEWEKRWKMIMETKKNIMIEKGEGGEVGNMKTEIHRMQVRYQQLKRAQDKLMHDLEHCVSRRDAIVTNAEAREKRVKGTQSNVIFNRKLDDHKNKLQQLQDDIKNAQDGVSEVEREIKFIADQKTAALNDIQQEKSRCLDIQNQIDEEKTNKQVKLELLLLQQRKLKVYVELSKNRSPFLLFKTQMRISEEYGKQKHTNTKLVEVIENLMKDFPCYYQTFVRILNTLKLSIYV